MNLWENIAWIVVCLNTKYSSHVGSKISWQGKLWPGSRWAKTRVKVLQGHLTPAAHSQSHSRLLASSLRLSRNASLLLRISRSSTYFLTFYSFLWGKELKQLKKQKLHRAMFCSCLFYQNRTKLPLKNVFSLKVLKITRDSPKTKDGLTYRTEVADQKSGRESNFNSANATR